MKQNATVKKIYLYLSISACLCYFIFVLLMYNSNLLPEIYTLSECSLYYVIVYSLLAAVSYCIDTQTKKEPAILSLFALPAHSFIFLLGMMFLASCEWIYFIIMTAIFIVIYVVGIVIYKKFIGKILLVKNAYENTLLAYTIIHVFMVLLSAFIMLNLL